MNRRPIFYLALGDSLTIGRGSRASADFVQLYQQWSEQSLKRQVVSEKFAKDGITSYAFKNSIETLPVIQQIEQADIITLTLGGNDFRRAWKVFTKSKNYDVLRSALFSTTKNIADILNRIKVIKEKVGKPYIVRVVNLYNPVKVPIAEQVVNTFNNQLAHLQTDYVKVANIYERFYGQKKQLLSIDGYHPNKYGYQVIAQALYELGYR
ncbi:lysophospholipase L1-like esterase [Salirhabdus euzebyi]|uniref:Lysophospholipase L1-like esterase n=1 Tax=Salirhabdus euzebyi TaxID=394506 RepID=A0A841Q5J7_9BACI|nr:GDSL-type esterase/lipase family protein [Salirhabdus euzebyi]MBB6453602.1 lysophospholipase L1-like esterase [Salirhabdus euzebyi]